MKKKPIDGHYDPQSKLRILSALVQVLLIVMIIGISIIVAIILKEVFFTPKKNPSQTADHLPLAVVEGDKVVSIYLNDSKMYLVLKTKNEKKVVRVINLQDIMELSR